MFTKIIIFIFACAFAFGIFVYGFTQLNDYKDREVRKAVTEASEKSEKFGFAQGQIELTKSILDTIKVKGSYSLDGNKLTKGK